MQNSESGDDGEGNKYASLDEMWKKELQSDQKEVKQESVVGSKEAWYKNQEQYWDKQKEDGSYNGVLGGYGFLHEIDVTTSKKLLEDLFSKKLIGKTRALDCGAGIGRVTKDLLSLYFEKIDILEQSEYYINEAKSFLKDLNIGKFYKNEQYNCIWFQWSAMYLTDEDFIQFLKKASKYLFDDGLIILKENVLDEGFVVDKQDCSITRSDAMYKEIFKAANYKIIHEELQKNFPEQLFPVKLYVCQKN